MDTTKQSGFLLPPAGVADLKVTQVRVLRSEWTKLRSLRSTYLTLTIAMALTVGLGALFSFGTQSRWARMSALQKAAFDPTATSLNGFFLTQLAIGVLGVLVFSGEYPTAMIRATFAAVPTRLPVLWAKLAVFAAVTFVLMTLTSVASFLVGQAVLSSENLGTTLGAPSVLRAVIGCALYLTVVAILGVSLGAILRSSAGGIATLVGLLLVVPILARLLPSDWADSINKYLPSNAGQAMLRVVPEPSSLAPWTGLALFVGYATVAVVIAAVLITRRDA